MPKLKNKRYSLKSKRKGHHNQTKECAFLLDFRECLYSLQLTLFIFNPTLYSQRIHFSQTRQYIIYFLFWCFWVHVLSSTFWLFLTWNFWIFFFGRSFYKTPRRRCSLLRKPQKVRHAPLREAAHSRPNRQTLSTHHYKVKAKSEFRKVLFRNNKEYKTRVFFLTT